MVCYPRPWISLECGGYLSSQSEKMKLLFGKVPQTQIYPALDALNQLSMVPWRIHTRVLDLAIKFFNFGGDKKLNIPLTPDDIITDQHLRISWTHKSRI